MSRDVVDENVLIVANGRAGHAQDRCVEACIDFLLDCRDRSSLVLDKLREILGRYARHSSWAGQPGVGDMFFVWAQESAAQLVQVELHGHPDRIYEEFPDSRELISFDLNDRLWVAASLGAGADGRVVNAVDSDYTEHDEALAASGVTVYELCPMAIRRGRNLR